MSKAGKKIIKAAKQARKIAPLVATAIGDMQSLGVTGPYRVRQLGKNTVVVSAALPRD